MQPSADNAAVVYDEQRSAMDALRDEALVARIRDGDAPAFETLYLAYYDKLVRFAHSYVHSRETAQEIVQDMFLSVWERRAVWDVHQGVRVYLYSAVRNRAFKTIRHERVVEREETLGEFTDRPPGMGVPEVSSEDAVEAKDLAAAIDRAIAALPERRRVALTLRWRHQLPYVEIARIMGSSVEAVTIQVARAREVVAKLVERYAE